MILSGVSGQLGNFGKRSDRASIKRSILYFDTAQKICELILHLRPTELEGRSLVEGLK